MAELFETAPEEVLRYFRSKRSVPTFDWRDIAPAEHAFSWTVAKSAGFDVLDDIRAAVDEAIEQRLPFETFRERLQPILEEKGWWGRRIATDPKDGRDQLVQLGSPRRLRTIYWANTATAHAAGEWERTQRTKGFLPFLLYTLSTAERRRPEHLAQVGTILPVDHEYWDYWFPPNGWGCECGTRQISRREAESRGYDPDAGAPPIEFRSWRNRRTGERVQVPVGIDPGWAQNPGKNRARNVADFLSERLDAMTDNRRRIAVADLVGSKPFRAIQSGEISYDPASLDPGNRDRGAISWPVAMLPDALAVALGTRTRTVRLSVADAQKQLRKRFRRSAEGTSPLLSAEDYARVQSMIENGRTFPDGERDLLVVDTIDGKPWVAVIRRTLSGQEIYLKSLRPLSARQLLRFERQ